MKSIKELGEKRSRFLEIRDFLRSGSTREFIEALTEDPELVHVSLGVGSLLHYASEVGDVDAVAFLVESGININFKGGVFETNALLNAVWKGHVRVVERLLEAGIEMDVSTKLANPLFSAIKERNVEIAELLIDSGIDTSVCYGEDKIDALEFAQRCECGPIIRKLGAEPRERTPFVNADLPDLTGIPNNNEKILLIESALNIRMPEYYKDYFLNRFPDSLYKKDAIDNDDWGWSGLAKDHCLFHTVRSFIAYNVKNPRLEEKELVAEGYLYLGTNGAADFWCIKLDERDDQMYMYNHEMDEIIATGEKALDFLNRIAHG